MEDNIRDSLKATRFAFRIVLIISFAVLALSLAKEEDLYNQALIEMTSIKGMLPGFKKNIEVFHTKWQTDFQEKISELSDNILRKAYRSYIDKEKQDSDKNITQSQEKRIQGLKKIVSFPERGLSSLFQALQEESANFAAKIHDTNHIYEYIIEDKLFLFSHKIDESWVKVDGVDYKKMAFAEISSMLDANENLGKLFNHILEDKDLNHLREEIKLKQEDLRQKQDDLRQRQEELKNSQKDSAAEANQSADRQQEIQKDKEELQERQTEIDKLQTEIDKLQTAIDKGRKIIMALDIRDLNLSADKKNLDFYLDITLKDPGRTLNKQTAVEIKTKLKLTIANAFSKEKSIQDVHVKKLKFANLIAIKSELVNIPSIDGVIQYLKNKKGKSSNQNLSFLGVKIISDIVFTVTPIAFSLVIIYLISFLNHLIRITPTEDKDKEIMRSYPWLAIFNDFFSQLIGYVVMIFPAITCFFIAYKSSKSLNYYFLSVLPTFILGSLCIYYLIQFQKKLYDELQLLHYVNLAFRRSQKK